MYIYKMSFFFCLIKIFKIIDSFLFVLTNIKSKKKKKNCANSNSNWKILTQQTDYCKNVSLTDTNEKATKKKKVPKSTNKDLKIVLWFFFFFFLQQHQQQKWAVKFQLWKTHHIELCLFCWLQFPPFYQHFAPFCCNRLFNSNKQIDNKKKKKKI